MDSGRIDVTLTLGEAERTAPALQHRETDSLRQELLRLGIDDVRWASAGAAPPGSRGLDLMLVGALVVQVAPALNLLTAVLGVVQTWAQRRAGRRVRIEIGGDSLEITDASRGDVDAAMAAFLRRHADGSASR